MKYIIISIIITTRNLMKCNIMLDFHINFLSNHYFPLPPSLFYRDMIFLGNSEGSEIKILFNESPKPSNNIFDYRMIEPNEDTTLAVQKHHTSNVAEVKLRGFAILTTKVFPNDDYLTRKNDDEVKIPYPPSIFVLTSSGEICLYHILDNRKEYYEKRILTEPVKFNTVKRQSAADTANP